MRRSSLALAARGAVDATAIPIEAPEPDSPGTTSLSSFRCGGVWFGLPDELVEGIVARSEVLAPPSERRGAIGVIRFREALITVLDASWERLRSISRPGTTWCAGGWVALVVDEVGGLVGENEGRRHRPPADVASGVVALVD